MSIQIREIEIKEINSIVFVHNKAFQDFFLTQLGNDFLKLYYTSILKHKNGILLGCFENDKLLGFCAATTYSKGFNSQLVKRNFISYGLTGIKLLFTNPGSLIRLINNFTKSDSSIDDKGDYAELLSIGVDPNIQSKGVGKQLLSELESLLINNKTKRLSLTTDYYNNDKAIGFYHSLGYEKMYEFTTYPNRKMYRLIKSLQS